MGEGDDGLRLSLSLEVPRNELNLMPFAPSNHLRNQTHLHEGQIAWNQLFNVSDKFLNAGSLIRGIDVNRTPTLAEAEDDAGVLSPNSTVSSTSGKIVEKGAILGDDNETERACSSRGISDEEDGENGDGSRKKLRLTKKQSLVLEETFKEHCTLNPKQKLALAKHLNLRPRQVEVWFQNRRARTKLKQTEADCEYLKRCCENLTAENRRLQKDVVELRALKLSPHLYTHMQPPTTLTMCPSCERLAVSSSSAAGNPSRHPAMASSAPHRKSLNPWAAIALQRGSAPASG